MEIVSEKCSQVGFAGVNMYDCDAYTAPPHADGDLGPSLSVQLELFGIEEAWHEFSFCALNYGYFFKTRSNMLW